MFSLLSAVCGGGVELRALHAAAGAVAAAGLELLLLLQQGNSRHGEKTRSYEPVCFFYSDLIILLHFHYREQRKEACFIPVLSSRGQQRPAKKIKTKTVDAKMKIINCPSGTIDITFGLYTKIVFN